MATALRSAERGQSDRPNGDRRGSANLRDNVGWTVAADRGNRATGRPPLRLKKSRILVLGTAMIAGCIAAYLASQIGRAETPPAAVAAPQTATRVLVASQEITAGQRLSPSSLTWQAWPEQALQTGFITATDASATMSDVSGLMARVGFLPGDPIRKEKLMQGSGGFLSGTLEKGMRGVSVVITAESASGGFISPNDHVDVVLTRTPATNGTGDAIPRSETVVHDALVLAINSQAATPGAGGQSTDQSAGTTFSGQAIATLALGPTDADIVVSASAHGKLSLLLRSVIDASDTDKKAKAQDSANQAIRMSSPFWLR